MPARVLSGPLLLFAVLFGYLTYEFGEQYAYGLIILVMLLVLTFVFAPQINWWWWMRNPPDLPKSLHPPLNQTPFYQRLSETNRRIFRQRVFLFNQAQKFMGQKGIDKITDDIKTAISTGAVQVNFHKLNFLYPDYQNIIIYAHPFPSPKYPAHMHASEVFEDEHGNGLIFSIEHVMRSFLEPNAYYNVCIHEYARLLIQNSVSGRFPKVEEQHWPLLEKVSGFPHNKLLEYMGLDELDPLQVAINYYLVFRERFQAVLPELTVKMDRAFVRQAY